MAPDQDLHLIARRYRESFAADFSPGFPTYMDCAAGGDAAAALGYARAGQAPLFLEAYLDTPIEGLACQALKRPVARTQIIEIGNFAAVNPIAMINLWGAAANDLAAMGDVAVATLTLPLRKMFRRIGVPFAEIADARAERLGERAASWGRYFEQEPRICAGLIVDGQRAINAFLDRRTRREVA